MWCHKHKQQHHLMPLIPMLAPHDANEIVNVTTAFWGLGQDNQNEVKHVFSGNVMPFVLIFASHAANGIKYKTTAFFRHLKLLWVIWCHWHWHHCHIMSTLLSVAPLHSLGWDNWNEVHHNFWSWHATGFKHHMMQFALVSASCDAGKTINGTIAFLRSWWSKWGVKWFF